ncbi:MAG: putative Ig domain-containing protein [Leptospiraceae bacterium]|nr:putative Ig domain-containing protein [Leptospiraceae bacterium]
MKGEIKNADVRVVLLSSDGKCNRSPDANILATSTTDDNGNFNIEYPKSGKSVCVIVTPKEDGSSTMYDESSKKDVPWTHPDAYFESIFVEPVTERPNIDEPASAQKLNTKIPNSHITPLTRIASRRLQTLAKGNTDPENIQTLVKQANREVTVRFGFHNQSNASRSLKNRANITPKNSGVNIVDDTVPEITKLNIDLSNLRDPKALKMRLILGGFSQIAKKVKSTTSVSDEDVETIVSAFAESMASGSFSDLDSNGNPITIGLDKNKINLGKNPLQNLLINAIIEYISEGGDKDLGVTPISIKDKLVFFDAEEPAFNPAPGLYVGEQKIDIIAPASTYLYYSTSALAPECYGNYFDSLIILPSGGDRILKAIACYPRVKSPITEGKYRILNSLLSPPEFSPTGGDFTNSVTISISQAEGKVIRYAFNEELLDCSTGSIYTKPILTNQTIKLKAISCGGSWEESYMVARDFVILRPPTGLSYAVPNAVYSKDAEIVPNYTIVVGENLSFSIDPDLPEGLFFNIQTGRITGTPTSAQAAKNYTITASNSEGSTSTILTITIGDTLAPPTNLSYPSTAGTYIIGSAITPLTPTVDGTGLTFSVTPALPTGLTVSPITGILSGIPSAAQGLTTHTITASNSNGSASFAISIIVVADVCSMTRDQVIQPSSWPLVQAYLQQQAALGTSGSETADTSTITGIGGSTDWSGGILATNGKIYGIPSNSTNVLIIDPSLNTANTSLITGLPGGSGKWGGGVLAPNGNIYGNSANSNSALIINPSTNSSDTSTITNLTSYWIGGVLAPNGNIYGMPMDATTVYIINPASNSADLSTITGLSGIGKWTGGVLAPNGKIYGIPFNSTNVLIIDPTTNTADTSTITGLSSQQYKWVGGVLSPNGKIYGIPYDSTSVLIIDPNTNTADTTIITGLSGSGKWYGGVLAPNGKIYGIPSTSTNVLVIDPNTDTASISTITGLSGTANKWYGGVIAANGKIYGMPISSTNVIIIDTKSNGSWCDAVLQSAYFNKL